MRNKKEMNGRKRRSDGGKDVRRKRDEWGVGMNEGKRFKKGERGK